MSNSPLPIIITGTGDIIPILSQQIFVQNLLDAPTVHIFRELFSGTIDTDATHTLNIALSFYFNNNPNLSFNITTLSVNLNRAITHRPFWAEVRTSAVIAGTSASLFSTILFSETTNMGNHSATAWLQGNDVSVNINGLSGISLVTSIQWFDSSSLSNTFRVTQLYSDFT